MTISPFYFALANDRMDQAAALADRHVGQCLAREDLATLREVFTTALHEVKAEGEALGYSDSVVEQAFAVYGGAAGRLLIVANEAGLLSL